MTPSGQRLSALPAAEQQAALAAMQPPGPSSAPAPPSPPKAPKAAERASQHPKRYPYSEKEIEAIMLGGAGGLDINISVQVNVEL